MNDIDKLISQDVTKKSDEAREDTDRSDERAKRAQDEIRNGARHALGCFLGDGGMIFKDMRMLTGNSYEVKMSGYRLKATKTEDGNPAEGYGDSFAIHVWTPGAGLGAWIEVQRPADLADLKGKGAFGG